MPRAKHYVAFRVSTELHRRGRLAVFTVLCLLVVGAARLAPVASAVAPLAWPPRADFQKGMSYVAYGADVYASPESDASLDRLARTGTRWVALVPIWYMPNARSTAIVPDPDLTPTDDSLRHVIRYLKAKGFKLMVKPYIDPLDDTWRALIRPTSWSAWFTSYRAFILHYAALAQQEGVEQFSVGVEYTSAERYEAEWRATIAAVRAVFQGPLTYAADYHDVEHDGAPLQGGYQNIAWWDALDYVGIDAYFPLSQKKKPTLADLVAGWTAALDEIEQWRTERGLGDKPVVFTELGFPSRKGAAASPGDWSKKGGVNLELQRLAYEATFRATADRAWLLGLFWWWWDNPTTGDYLGGKKNRFYTPKNKPAEVELTKWYTAPAGSVLRRR